MFIEKNGCYKLIDADEDSLLLKKLDAGTYNLKIHKSFFGTSYSFDKTTVYDRGTVIKTGMYKSMWDKVEEFISPEMAEARDLMQSINKMGMLFYGKPGTGKTFLAGQIGKYIRGMQPEAVTIIINSWSEINNIAELVDEIRKFAKDQMLILIFDEFEKVNRHAFNNSDFLSFLDGSNSKEKVLLIATANDKSALPDTLLERPGRFEVVMEFKNTEETWSGIINSLFPTSLKDEEAMTRTLNKVKSFKGECTIDHIRIMVRDELVYLIRKKNGKDATVPTTLENVVNTFNGGKDKVGFKQQKDPIDVAKTLDIGELQDILEEKYCKELDNDD